MVRKRNYIIFVSPLQAHGEMFMVQNFATVVQGIADHGVAGALTHLCQLYATHNILHYSGDFLEVRKKLLYVYG